MGIDRRRLFAAMAGAGALGAASDARSAPVRDAVAAGIDDFAIGDADRAALGDMQKSAPFGQWDSGAVKDQVADADVIAAGRRQYAGRGRHQRISRARHLRRQNDAPVDLGL